MERFKCGEIVFVGILGGEVMFRVKERVIGPHTGEGEGVAADLVVAFSLPSVEIFLVLEWERGEEGRNCRQ